MDFSLSADQEALREGVARFCAGRIGIETLRRLEGTGFEPALWRELADLGVFGLRSGGSDGTASGLADAALVFEALGRALAPGPILWTHLAADRVPGAASGDVVVTGAVLDRSGRKGAVIEHLGEANVLLVLRDDGVDRIDAASVRADAEATSKPLDPLTPVFRARSLPAGQRIADAAAADRMRLEGTTLAAAQLLGIAEETLALATRHANERHQFDRPIGSFQAIKHLLADAYVRQELARASVYAAAVLLDAPGERGRSVAPTDDSPARRAVAAAKLVAGDAAMKNARTCIQVLGGMGFTWESPVHYALKRTWVLTNGFGSPTHEAERLSELVAAQA